MAQGVKKVVPMGLKRFRPVPQCLSCQYSMKHKKFHDDLLASTYFDENGIESISEVMKKHRITIPYRNVALHVNKHLAPVKNFNDEKKAELERRQLEVSETEMAKAIAVPDAETAYERALDETIDKFHQQLKDGRLKLTVSTGLQAIKIKADMVSKNNDRKLDFLKAFSAMGQQKDDNA